MPGRDWLRVERLEAMPGELHPGELAGGYDLLLVGLGYETRSRFVHGWLLKSQKVRTIAFAYDIQTEWAFGENVQYFASEGAEVVTLPARGIYDFVKRTLSDHRRANGPIRIALDVSVLDRTRLACAFLGIADCRRDVDVDLLYAPAEFEPPPIDEPPLVVREPVHERLSGWPSDPNQSVNVVVGVGYEREKAVGAVEFLEPAATWVFVPEGSNPKYNEAVLDGNASLLHLQPPRAVIRYGVLDPFGCFETLESLTYGLSLSGRPVLVPMGPKLFSVICFAVAFIHAPDVSVWRFSSGAQAEARDRFADGTVAGLGLRFRP